MLDRLASSTSRVSLAIHVGAGAACITPDLLSTDAESQRDLWQHAFQDSSSVLQPPWTLGYIG